MSDSGELDRGDVMARGIVQLAKWSACMVAIAAAIWVIWYVLGQLWTVVLPVLLALVVTTVLWPVTRWLRRHRVPAAAAAALTLAVFLALFFGIVAAIIPSVAAQAPDLADKSVGGVNKVRDWLQGPPLNIRDEQLNSAASAIISRLERSGDQIAAGVFTGVSSTTSAVISGVLIFMLIFFFLKDGTRFTPWLPGLLGRRVGGHVAEVADRVWANLGGFIRTQALISLMNATFIGTGLVILGVPLALPLAVMTFIASFIPIVGAVIVGVLVVLVALVGNDLSTAIIALIIVITVQQLEGNVLQPILQARSMKLHAAVVLLSVTAGGSLFGIMGAFLAVPVVSAATVVLKYVSEQIDADANAESTTTPDYVPGDEFSDDKPAGEANPPAPAGNPPVPG